MFTADPDYVPFCGMPPVPAELMARWTLDPFLLAGLVAAWAFGFWRLAKGPRRTSYFAGLAITAIMFVSPLCALSMALFSARVGQHLVLTLIAAPLLARAFNGRRVSPMAAAIVFSGFFWFWHLPTPYQATLESDWTYWAMHLSLLGAAVAYWAAIITQMQSRPLQSFLSAIVVGTQMSVLSALLVFSGEPWHLWHEATTPPYGLTALTDQALAGGMMWVFGAAVFVAAIGLLIVRVLVQAEDGEARPAPGRAG